MRAASTASRAVISASSIARLRAISSERTRSSCATRAVAMSTRGPRYRPPPAYAPVRSRAVGSPDPRRSARPRPAVSRAMRVASVAWPSRDLGSPQAHAAARFPWSGCAGRTGCALRRPGPPGRCAASRSPRAPQISAASTAVLRSISRRRVVSSLAIRASARTAVLLDPCSLRTFPRRDLGTVETALTLDLLGPGLEVARDAGFNHDPLLVDPRSLSVDSVAAISAACRTRWRSICRASVSRSFSMRASSTARSCRMRARSICSRSPISAVSITCWRSSSR